MAELRACHVAGTDRQGVRKEGLSTHVGFEMLVMVGALTLRAVHFAKSFRQEQLHPQDIWVIWFIRLVTKHYIRPLRTREDR